MNKDLFEGNRNITSFTPSAFSNTMDSELLPEPGLFSKVVCNLEDVITQLRKIDSDLDLVYGNIFIDPNSPIANPKVCDKEQELSLDKKILNDFDTINTYLKYISGTISKLQASL